MAAAKDKRREEMRERFREEVKQRYANQSTFGGNTINLPEGVEFYKIEDGKNVLDVIPWTTTRDHFLEGKLPIKAGVMWWRVRYLQHRGIGVNNEAVVCPRTMDKRCAICEARDDLMRQEKEDEAKALSASFRLLFLIRAGKALKAVDVSEWAFWKKMRSDMRVAEDKGLKDVFLFFYPDGGMTCNAWFEDASFPGSSKPYKSCARVDFVEREDLDSAILKAAEEVRLDQCLEVMSHADLTRKFLGIDAEDDAHSSRGSSPKHIDEEEGTEEAEPMPEPTPEPAARRPAPKQQEVNLDDLDEEGLLDYIQLNELDLGLPFSKLIKCSAKKMRDLIRGSMELARDQKPTDEKPVGKVLRTKSGDTCPHGHQFGVDTDDFKVCEECKIWDECTEEHNRKSAKR